MVKEGRVPSASKSYLPLAAVRSRLIRSATTSFPNTRASIPSGRNLFWAAGKSRPADIARAEAAEVFVRVNAGVVPIGPFEL